MEYLTVLVISMAIALVVFTVLNKADKKMKLQGKFGKLGWLYSVIKFSLGIIFSLLLINQFTN